MKPRAVLLLAFLSGCQLWVGGQPGTRVTPGEDSSVEDAGDEDSVPPIRYVPSHTMTMFVDGASDLVDPTALDTDSLTIAFGGATGPPPSGVSFMAEGSRAVLRVGAFTASLPLRVVGGRALIIVASRTATIGGRIDAAARLGSAGPGGAQPNSGPGAGATGESGMCEGGGAGASFGDLGGAGGSTTCGGAAKAGVVHGAKLTDFFGGSGGGSGGGSCSGSGGAGGGAIQISSLIAVRVLGTGGINVGGGGGAGGCGGPDHGGGGGGSGGTIFLEGPTVDVSGLLAANGGGGGEGGDSGFLSWTDGDPGADGLPDITSAAGGAHVTTDRSGGAGGSRAAGAQSGMGGADVTGGGGGAVGRIWLRTRTNPAMPSGKISPAPTLDTSL
jgi:hypothetical protein